MLPACRFEEELGDILVLCHEIEWPVFSSVCQDNACPFITCPITCPSRLDRRYVLDKLLDFHQKHHTPPHLILRDMQHAANQIPKHEQAAEAVPLREKYQRARRSRQAGPKAISEVLLAVLARYGITGLESDLEASGPDASSSDTSTG